MKNENKDKISSLLRDIEKNVMALHQQAHTGVLRLDGGYAATIFNRIDEIRKIVMDDRTGTDSGPW